MNMQYSCIYKDFVILDSFEIIQKIKGWRIYTFIKRYITSYIIQTSGRLLSRRYRRGFPSFFLLRPLSIRIEIYSTFSCKEFLFLAMMSCTSSDTLLSKEIKHRVTRDCANQKFMSVLFLAYNYWMKYYITVILIVMPNKYRKK